MEVKTNKLTEVEYEVANRMNRMSDEAKREILQASIVMRQSFPGTSLLIIDDED